MDEEKTTKTSKAQLKANVKYRSEKCIRKELVFYPSELELLDKAEDIATLQGKSFTKYIKDLIFEDIEKQARLF